MSAVFPRGPSEPHKLTNGTDISKMTVAEIDHELLQERHQRRLALMRMQGDINRQERRAHIMIAVGVVGLLIALALA